MASLSLFPLPHPVVDGTQVMQINRKPKIKPSLKFMVIWGVLTLPRSVLSRQGSSSNRSYSRNGSLGLVLPNYRTHGLGGWASVELT